MTVIAQPQPHTTQPDLKMQRKKSNEKSNQN